MKRRPSAATAWAPGGPTLRFHIGLEDPGDLIADLEAGLEVDQAQVRGLAGGDPRSRQVVQGGAGGHPLDHRRERDLPGHDQLGEQGSERGLEARRSHRRLLERDFLLVPGVRRVIGGDAVDHAAGQRLDKRPAVRLGAQRRVHLEAAVERAHDVVGEREMVRADLAADPRAGGLRLREGVNRLDAREVLEMHARVLVSGQRAVARDHRRL